MGGKKTIVTTFEVKAEAFTDSFRSVGTAKAKANVMVESETAGRVTEVHFGPNQLIQAGAPLVTIEDRVEQIALRSAKANLAEARATLKRYDTLREAGSGAVSAVSVTEAGTQVEIAEAAVERAEYDLDLKTIRAPISGTLGLTDVEPGMYLGLASEIVKITDQTYLSVEFGLPDRASGIVQVGQTVWLTTGSLPGRVFEGTVDGFDGQIDSTTRTIKVRAGIENAQGLMLPGMVFNVILDDQNAPLPVVPANAITWSRQGAAVWTVKNGKAEPVLVSIRHRENDRVWLNGDLPDGTSVIVEGVQKVRQGEEVTTKELVDARRKSQTSQDGDTN
ncbi:efflux RND transporter periplasmic adaptor subunit [Shimia isoporae]|nr:efflux RND transporter periplasmic adaptor subunit [Shimia isoporae]